jgi:cell division transport system permease protein
MARRVSDVPLETDGSGRFLPWLTGLMVYLAALAIVSACALSGAIDRWDAGLAGTLTVQLPRPVDGTPLPQDKLDRALDLLHRTPGIVSAAPLDDAAQAALLKPWLDGMADVKDLPLPVLVDVRLADGATLDTTALEAQLGDIIPGSIVATHDRWLGRLFRTARAIELTSFGIVVLIGLATVATIVFVVRTGLLIHHSVIELLHMVGAQDVYIAQQFQNHAFRLGVRGGLVGILAAFITFGIAILAGGTGMLDSEQQVLPGAGLPLAGWVAVLLLPLIAGLIALLTARVTVLRALGRLP